MLYARQRDDNGLLLLLRAAETIEADRQQRTDKWENRAIHRQSCASKRTLPSSGCISNYTQKRPITGNSNSRAHLRTCMENLKKRLQFDNDVPRITMLTVLKKATGTIQSLHKENQSLVSSTCGEEQRNAQLCKRRVALKKRFDEKRNHSKLQNLGDRNRNFSECSVTTTSSDDSEQDQHRTGPLRRFTSICAPSSPPARLSNVGTSDGVGQNGTLKRVRNVTSSADTVGVSPVCLDTFDASSSDSGFEEGIATSEGKKIIGDTSTVYCMSDNSQCGLSFVEKACRVY